MEYLQDQIQMIQDVSEVSSDSLSDLEKQLVDTFLNNRVKDMKKYELAYNRAYGRMAKAQKKFFDDTGTGFDKMAQRMSNIANIWSAVNISGLKDSLKETATNSAESLWRIRSSLNLNDKQMGELKDDLQKAAEKLSSQADGTISREDLYNAVEVVVHNKVS